MTVPAELLLIKDQYDLAFHCLSQGLAAEEAGRQPEALEYYKKGRRHLTNGLEVPTKGERQRGAPWDTARQLQQKMREVLRNLSSHLNDLETGQPAAESRRSRVLMDHPAHLYPTLGLFTQAPRSSNLHLYPSLPTSTFQTPTPDLPARPAQKPALAPQTPAVPSQPAQLPPAVGIPVDQPPAYTPRPTEGHHSLAYSPTTGGLGTPAANESGEELLYIPSGVQLFLVAPDGQVSSLFYPGFLRIAKLESQGKDPPPGRPSALLQVNEWLYPLMADTPVLLATSGIYMFPDVAAEAPGSYVGIVLSSELPASNTEMFQDILSQLTDLRVQAAGEGSEVINLTEKVPLGPPREEKVASTETTGEEILALPEWSEKIAQNILAGAAWLSKGLVKGGDATGKAIHKGASKLRDNITPEEKPSEVSPSVTKGLQTAKQATGGAVRVSRFLVNGVSAVAVRMGEKLAPHVKKHSAKLIPESMKKSEDGRASNFEGAKFVAISSVQGLSAVWAGLETGAKTVGKSVSSETVTTVTYKYGDQAGQATDTAVQSVVNVAVTACNIDNLGIKALLKTTGKQTAKNMIGQKGQAADAGKEENPEKIKKVDD